MTDDQGKKSFWTTLPGILTGIGTLAAAIAALITALWQTGVIGAGTAEDPQLLLERLWVEPQQVEAAEQPTIIAEVANSGKKEEVAALSLEIDGQVFESKNVSVAAGTQVTVSFIAPPLPAGLHVVRVADAEARYLVGSGPGTNCALRTGIQVRLQNVVDKITRVQDGHLELSFRNPAVNDCPVDTDLRIAFPTNLVVYGKEGIESGTTGTLNAVAREIPPGGERTSAADFRCQNSGTYVVSFSGTYWPTGNKDLFQPITLQQSLICEESSEELSLQTPTTTVNQGTIQPAAPMATTPGDRFLNQFEVAIGQVVVDGKPGPGAGNIETPGVFDIYTLKNVQPGQRGYLDIQESFAGGPYGKLIEGEDPFSEEAPVVSEFSGDIDDLVLEKGGTYSLLIWASGDATGTYKFRIEGQ
jgi:hypothetical protein